MSQQVTMGCLLPGEDLELLIQLSSEIEIVLLVKAVGEGKVSREEQGEQQAVKGKAGNGPEDEEKFQVDRVAKVGIKASGT